MTEAKRRAMRQIELARAWRRAHQRERRLSEIATRYRDFTMIPASVFRANLELASDLVLGRGLQGDVVECGVWRGGMTAGLAEVLGQQQRYCLFDSFQGLPSAKGIDGTAALAWQADTESPGFFDNCTAEITYAEEAMRMSGARDFRIYKGWFADTLPVYAEHARPIALLRLDGDWYESTMEALESLCPLVCDGGVVVVDDYDVWDGCAKAVHDYLSQTRSTARLRRHGPVVYLDGFQPSGSTLVVP